MNGSVAYLVCSVCGRRFEAGKAWDPCDCGGPLLAQYELDALRHRWTREALQNGPRSMWRYAPVLPLADADAIVSLGEGLTPLVRARRLGKSLGASGLWIKNEAPNPTGSFQARGFACVVTMAAALGVRKLALASSGNAGGALAAYAAAAGLEAHVSLPRDALPAATLECRAFGARVSFGDTLSAAPGWHDAGALPYRLEGIKTLGYEVAEQFAWELPDAILCPAGEGLALLGMWKAFGEMEQLGWIPARRPRMIAVQAEGCQPLVRAFEAGAPRSEFWPDAHTVAAGLRVPKPPVDFLVLDAVRSSGGTCVAAGDQDLLDAGVQLASAEGILPAPEGAACVAALSRLLASGFLKPEERILLCNTGSGLKYLDLYQTRFPRLAAGEQDKLGGLITPR